MGRSMTGAHGRAGRGAVRRSWPDSMPMRPGRCYVPDNRAVVMRGRRRRAIDRMVMPMRREQDWGKYGHDIGGSIVRTNAHTTGIDTIGSHGNATADDRPGCGIMGGTTGKSSAEQCGTEQGGKALHGLAPCRKHDFKNFLPSFT